MDIISHGLVGTLIATFKKDYSKRDIALVSFSGALPDLTQIPLYLYIGYLNHRPYWIPLNDDWFGFREGHPFACALWDIPHSLLFFFLVLIPLVFVLKLPRLFIAGYASHIFIDLFTHTGEWGVKLFYPSNYLVNGFTDAWAWNPVYFLFAWSVILFLILGVRKIVQKKTLPR